MLTADEAGAYLGISGAAVRWRIRHGLLRGERAGSRLWLVPMAEIERVSTADPVRRGPKPRAERQEDLYDTDTPR